MNEESIHPSLESEHKQLTPIPYHPDRFDEGYYHGERRGLVDYEYDSKTQQEQLPLKFDALAKFGDLGTVLFVGCARGFEVRYFRERGIDAWGIDVSKWAIENGDYLVKDFCRLYDGENIPFEDNQFRTVAAFDVLQLPPDDLTRRLIHEMVRVSNKYLYYRNHVRAPYEIPGNIHGMDGVTISSRSFDFYMQATMEKNRKPKRFFPKFGRFSHDLECEFWFEIREHK